jgi:hypothetical protein
MNNCSYSVSVHWLAFPNVRRGSVSFLQFLCAVIAAHLNRFAADLDVRRIAVQRAIAGCTSFSSHDLFLRTRGPRRNSRPLRRRGSLSESLAICGNRFNDSMQTA